MKIHWPLVAAILAVLSVPFALAVLDDSDRDPAKAPEGTAGASTATELEAPRETEAPDTAGRPPAAEWEKVHAMDFGFFATVFFAGEGSEHPAFVGPFAGLRPGLSREELGTRFPALDAWARAGSKRFPAARLDLLMEGGAGTLSGVEIDFPDDGTARRIFAARWGAPRSAVSERGLLRRIWLAPEQGARLTLREIGDRAVARLDRYQPLRALIAPGDRHRFGFERLPLLGATAAEVTRAYSNRVIGPISGENALLLELPATEFGDAPIPLELDLEGGRVARVQVTLSQPLHERATDEALELLEQKLGPPKTTGEGLSYGRPPWVRADVRDDAVVLVVTAPK